MVFSGRPPRPCFSFHGLFGVRRSRRSRLFSWRFFGCFSASPSMVFSALRAFPGTCRDIGWFSGFGPPALTWFFWRLRIGLPGTPKLANFPGSFSWSFRARRFFGRPFSILPRSFDGFFGLPARLSDPPILANISADFRPAQPSSTRFSNGGQGGLDCQLRISHTPWRLERNGVIRTR